MAALLGYKFTKTQAPHPFGRRRQKRRLYTAVSRVSYIFQSLPYTIQEFDLSTRKLISEVYTPSSVLVFLHEKDHPSWRLAAYRYPVLRPQFVYNCHITKKKKSGWLGAELQSIAFKIAMIYTKYPSSKIVEVKEFHNVLADDLREIREFILKG